MASKRCSNALAVLTSPRTMTDENTTDDGDGVELLDDRWFNGVYYDSTTDEYYTFKRANGGVELVNAATGVFTETLGSEEFKDLQPRLMHVDYDAVADPAEYVEHVMDEYVRNQEMFDASFEYADRLTEVVNVEVEHDD